MANPQKREREVQFAKEMEEAERFIVVYNGKLARLQAIYPYLVLPTPAPVLPIHPDDDDAYDNAEDTARQRRRECAAQHAAIEAAAAAAAAAATNHARAEEDGGTWPYFFVRPPADSRSELMPALQQVFVESFVPHNRTLLRAWMRMFDVNLKLADRVDDRRLIGSWAHWAYESIRARVSRHPAAAAFTDLLSLLPHVAKGLARPEFRADWEFYQRVFMPGPHRLAVPLPVGLVLFEGRRLDPTAKQVLQDRLRRPPFSTSWHPNVAIDFALDSGFPGSLRHGSMFAHKIMSDGILGVDVQQVCADRNDDGQYRIPAWHECEVIVQPLVSFHQADEARVWIDRRNPNLNMRDGKGQAVWVHVIFTHAFLGDVCPCEAQKEAVAASHHQHAPEPEPKRQRLQGRLQLD